MPLSSMETEALALGTLPHLTPHTSSSSYLLIVYNKLVNGIYVSLSSVGDSNKVIKLEKRVMGTFHL